MQVTAVAQGNEKRKSRGEVVKYTHDFLMKFAEVRFISFPCSSSACLLPARIPCVIRFSAHCHSTAAGVQQTAY